MGALVGLGVGVALLLVWSAFAVPRSAARAPRTRASAVLRSRFCLDACLRSLVKVVSPRAGPAAVSLVVPV